ncbi:MAG: cytidylate kinase-like family protein [bacterium]|nr:cytidylate kinase-like family protein [bacterium]
MARSYAQMVDKALRLFQLKKEISGLIPTDDAFPRPFITIARDPGSGGKPIAMAVAKKLNFEFIDQQIIDEIANSTKKRRAIIKELDEKSRSRIDDIVHSVLNVEYVSDTVFISEMMKVIIAHACKGNVVILGRGANSFTPQAKGLHVNVTAPYSVRVSRAMEFEGFNNQQAKETIAKVEAEREEFVKQYFVTDNRRRNVFDLTINTTYFTVPRARDIIIEAFKQKFSE